MTVEIKEDEGMKDKGEVEGNRIERLRAPKNEGPDSEAGARKSAECEGSTACPRVSTASLCFGEGSWGPF